MIREEMNDEKRKEEEVRKEVKGKQVAATLQIREMYGI